MSRELFNGLFMTEHRKSGKMMNMDSFMFMHPPFCKDRKVGVCSKCYSKKLSSYRPCLAKRQAQNTEKLSSKNFKSCKFNTINGVIRWGSFGELANKEMFEHICSMARINNHLIHALWTKRAGIVSGYYRPTNLKLVWSATKIDVEEPFVPEGFDMGFFVYSSEDKIPKGAFHCKKQCFECMYCYKKTSRGIIAEVIR